MNSEVKYVAEKLRRLSDSMDTISAWLPDGVEASLDAAGGSLVVELSDGDDHYGSIDPEVLVGVGADDGPLKARDAEFTFESPSVTFSIKEFSPTPDVMPLVERVREELFARNEPLSDEVAIQIPIPGTALSALANLYVKTNGDVVTYRRVDVCKFQTKYLDAAAWAEDMEAVNLDTERRVPEVGEWYIKGACTLYLRVSESTCFSPWNGEIHRGVGYSKRFGRDVITDDMTPYLFGGTDE